MTVSSKSNLWALLSLLLLALIWSYNWVVMKSVTLYMGAFDFSSLRCLFGALVLFILLKLRGKGMKPPPLKPVIWIGLLQTCGMVGLSQWALMAGGAGKVAVLAYTMPFWMIILAAVFLNERLRRFQYLAFVLGGVGLLLVLKPWDLHSGIFSSVLAILSGFTWAVGSVIIKRMYSRQSVDLLSLTAWQMGFGAIVLAVIAILVHEKPIIWSTYVFVALGYNAILATALAWILWLYILKNLPAGIASLSTLLVPVGGVLWAWWLLNEVPDRLEGIGIVLIVAALAVVIMPQRKPKVVSLNASEDP